MARLLAPGLPRAAARETSWLVDALRGIGRLTQPCVAPRIDAESVRSLYPSGLTDAQAEALRSLMSPREFARVDPNRTRKGGR
jgi:hypothetical protein